LDTLGDVTGIAEPKVDLGLIGGGSGASKEGCSEKGADGAEKLGLHENLEEKRDAHVQRTPY
jgi:hypothetical protein